jgi:hypothetical protein
MIWRGLHNSPHYFERLQKILFAMVHQLGLPTFIVISTSIERLWDFFIKKFTHITCFKIKSLK